LSAVKDIYDGLRRILTMEDRVTELAESVKLVHAKLENHAERLARLEGKFELLESSLSSRRKRLPE
jgi:hypothetical protein